MSYFRSPDVVTEDCSRMVASDGVAPGNDLAGLCFRVEYYNYTGYPVTIVDRRGVCMTVDSSPIKQGLNYSVYVVQTYGAVASTVNFDRPCVSNADQQYVEINKALSEKRKHIGMQARNYSEASVLFEIPYADISDYGSVYYRNLDVVLSIKNAHAVPAHPYDFSGALRTELESDEYINSKDKFGIGIKLVDINGRYGHRFININGRIFRIPVSRDPTLKDGLYIEMSERVLGDVGEPPPPDIQYYTFEEYQKACEVDSTLLRLHTTFALARSLGDMASQRKEELENLAFDRKRAEEEQRRDKLEYDKKVETLRREYAETDRINNQRIAEAAGREKELEHQMKMNELEATRRLTEYKSRIEDLKHEAAMEKAKKDNTNSWFRDASDVLKNVAGVLGAVAVLYVAYDKFKAKTNP